MNERLTAEIVHPPPDNQPPGYNMKDPEANRTQGVGRTPTDEVMEQLSAQQVFLKRLLSRFEQAQFLPELKTIGFNTSAQAWGTPAAPNLIVPAMQSSNAIYIVGIWFSSLQALLVEFGQGQSALDAEPFPSYLGVSPQLPVAANGGFSMTAGRPNWIFRCDPGKGFMINLSAATQVGGYVSYFVADVSKERPADLS